jgi:uncharacterized protein YbaP (TraB family)
MGATARAAEEKLPLWKVDGGKTTVWLLGSIHLLKNTDYPLPDPIEQAYTAAEVVVFETDMKALESPATQMQMLTKGRLPNGGKLSDELSEATYRDLMEHAKNAGLPPVALESLKPSMAVMMIVAVELMKMGFDPEQGVDQYFFKRSQQDGKQITPLETVEFQIDLLTNITKEEGELMVKTTLEEFETLQTVFNELVDVWRKGDTAKLDQWLNEAKKDAPKLMRRFLTDRNERWVTKIQRLAEQDKPVLVVVGAAHLVGEKSVVELLEKRGLKAVQQ